MIDFVYNWNYTLGSASTPFYRAFGNPTIDTTSNLLQLTYDDIVQKRTRLTSATGAQCYYFKGNVCPQNTQRALMFQPFGNSVQYYPTLRGNVTSYSVGGTFYGTGDYVGAGGELIDSYNFHSFGCLSGQSLQTNTLSYGFFMNVTEAKLAFVVTDGTHLYNSGFVELSGSDKNTLGWYFVAQNAPFTGTGEARITSVYGSYEMTVDELMEVYNTPLAYVSAASFSIIPESQYASIGDTVTFRAGATPGDCTVSTISWRWYKDGEIIAGQNNSTLTISGVSLSDYGAYQVAFTSNFVDRVSNIFNLFSITGLIFELDKNNSPSPGYFKVYDRTTTLPTSAVDYEILFKIEDTETSGANYRSYHTVQPWGSFEVQLFGLEGTTYNISMSASYDIAPEG
jgi:hypothetical protein